MMKSVGEIASKIWPVIYFLTHFGVILTLTLAFRSLMRIYGLSFGKCQLDVDIDYLIKCIAYTV